MCANDPLLLARLQLLVLGEHCIMTSVSDHL
jgi:hypothetical protein